MVTTSSPRKIRNWRRRGGIFKEVNKNTALMKALYHYTSIEALTKILRPDHICFWVTHHKYLNDPSEFGWGENIAKTLFPQCDYLKNDIFILSLSQCKDFLPMWSMYSQNGNGIALELEYSSAFCLENSFAVCECIYDIEGYEYFVSDRNIIESMMAKKDEVAEKYAQTKMLFYPYTFKHPAYEYEKEVRFIFEKKNNEKLEFKEKGNILIPCVERIFDKLFIKSITLGPIQKEGQEKSVELLKKFLSKNKYEHLIDKISVSQVPYRG